MTEGRTHPVMRAAVEEDLADLQVLARRTIDASYRSFLGDESVDAFVDSGAADAYVATYLDQGAVHCLCEGREIVGFCILDGPTIDLMMVDPRHQRRGLGRLLLASAESILFVHHATIRLESFTGNTAANAFYEVCGWSSAGRPDSDGLSKVEYIKWRESR